MASRPPEPARADDDDEIPRLDEQAAWSLVRSVRPGARTLLQVHDSKADVSLRVYPSGAWDTPTRWTEEARQILDVFLPLQLQPDLVIAQAGQSLDGRIATDSGHSHYVTGPQDIRRLHRLRALVDAVIVGAGTIAADDPRLTVREAEGDNPVRVVIDPSGRLDRSRRVFRDRAAPTVVIRRRWEEDPGRRPPEREASARSRLAAGCDTALDLPAGPSGTIDPHDVLAALRDRGCRRFLIEGGGVTVSRFLDAGAVDRLHVAVAPLLIGSGRPAFTLAPIATLEQAIRPVCRVFRLGDDVLFDLDLRAPVRPAAPADPGDPP